MKAQRPKVAKFGVSIFFTTLSPDLSDKTIIKNNYIYFAKKYQKNVECAFGIHKNQITMTKVNDVHRRDIQKYEYDIDLNKYSDFKLICRKNVELIEDFLRNIE